MVASFRCGLLVQATISLLTIISNVKSQQINRILKVVVAEQPPFIERIKDSNGQLAFRGICIDLMDQIANIVGFNYTMYYVPDGVFDMVYNKSTGQWNGMMAELVKKVHQHVFRFRGRGLENINGKKIN